MPIHRSSCEILVHVVWATRRREALLPGSRDGWLHSVLHELAARCETELLAAGNTDDHVHLVIRPPPTREFSFVVQCLKGGSSHAWNHATEQTHRLEWQDGYWAESVSPSGLSGVRRYVSDQRRRHEFMRVPEPWELALFGDSKR